MNKIILNNKSYEIIDNFKDCFDFEEVESLFTDYFFDYDYVLGDYAYGKFRLKGFYNSKNKKVNNINDISNYKKYLKEYCSVECPYFLIKKENIIEKNK